MKKWERCVTAAGALFVEDADGSEVCVIGNEYSVYDANSFDEANARLICAAPDLLEALEELISRRERACAEHGRLFEGSDGRYARALTAVLKARGVK